MAISLIVCIVGGVVYLLCNLPAEISDRRMTHAIEELGRLAFFAGLLAYLMR